jgi:hypothetical protein
LGSLSEATDVCRLRDNSRYQIEEERPLAAEDVEAGIVLDAIVCLGEYQGGKDRPDHPLRLVMLKTTPHEKRGRSGGGSTGPASNGLRLIASNLLDLPACIITLLYRYRGTIEIFFRFFISSCNNQRTRATNGSPVLMGRKLELFHVQYRVQ